MIRRKLTPAQRRRIYQSMHERCAYCGCEIKYHEMTLDHIKPLACGGADEESNLLPACRSCNHRKGTSSLERFREQVERFPAVLARDSVTYKNAVRFGLVIPNPHAVKFYFERLEEETQNG